jgi:hypothetical protein
MLLFGRDERLVELLPRATVFVTRFSGDSLQSPVIEKVKLNGSLLSLYEGITRFVGRYCDLHDARPRRSQEETEESPIPARADYHRGVVSEAITNLLAHRDLALRDQPSRVHIFDHSLEFVNARRSLGFSPIAQKAIRYGCAAATKSAACGALKESCLWIETHFAWTSATAERSSPLFEPESRNRFFNDEFRLRVYGV